MIQTKDIQGWFGYQKTFDFLLENTPENGVFVECGAWLGKSSSYLCDKVKELDKGIKVFIVDSWKGSKDELKTHHELATKTDIFKIFTKNMDGRTYTPVRKYSVEAAKDFNDNSCDVVFIDMGHTYEEIKEDIAVWLPKVKKGGYLAGHDYPTFAGVKKAVEELNGFKASPGNCWIKHIQ